LNKHLGFTPPFKFKKEVLKVEGFNNDKINDSLYVMLPGESEYIPLTKEIYDGILDQKYRF